MRVSAIFAQGGGRHGHGGGYGCDYGYGCDDYFRYRGDHYHNGYSDQYYYDYDRGDEGILGGLLG